VIINDAAATNVVFGADGKLPELSLNKPADETEEPVESSSKSSLLVIAALVGSFLFSVVMLFLPTDSSTVQATKNVDARKVIEAKYIQPETNGKLKEYQRLLREALQAHSQGDRRVERLRYRQVLNLLHAENNSATRGLTGVRKNLGNKPNDEELENQLSKLLSER